MKTANKITQNAKILAKATKKARRTQEEIKEAVAEAVNCYFTTNTKVTKIQKMYRLSSAKLNGAIIAELYNDPDKTLRYEGRFATIQAANNARSGNDELILPCGASNYAQKVTRTAAQLIAESPKRLIKNKILG